MPLLPDPVEHRVSVQNQIRGHFTGILQPLQVGSKEGRLSIGEIYRPIKGTFTLMP
jgi:hypothetical protein